MLNNLYTVTAIFFSIFVALVFGCVPPEQDKEDESQNTKPTISKAIAHVRGAADVDISGSVAFEKTDEGIRVTARLNGLNTGKHGFHIHQYGDCTASDFSSAGGHYNPYDKDHGSPTQDNRHIGDMGNIVADSEGQANLNYVDPLIELNGTNSVIGRAVVIHADADDLESQPSGAAGARIACGVIGIDQ